ncbi:TetR/AcrR family transcriptional regulator [Thalassotalea marina]|uniref:TetR/AcrR family transcriptional regulator n=1 Tax=Thalassotalea marina TaxID=1673741 RepID=UPI001676F800|nr:TetR/AcrR family transcriptional regulator [Thalassotalea marina]
MQTKTRAISERDKEKRKQVILMAALEQFYLQGFKATRMDDIANMAGVSKGTLYLYFKTKEELFQAIIEQVALPKLGELTQLLEQSPSVKQGLSNMFNFLPKVILYSPLPKLIKVIISDSFAFPEVAQNYREQVIEKGLMALTKLLDKGNTNKEINVENSKVMARLVIAPVIFSVIWYVILNGDNKSENDINALFQQHLRNMFCSLGIKEN